MIAIDLFSYDLISKFNVGYLTKETKVIQKYARTAYN